MVSQSFNRCTRAVNIVLVAWAIIGPAGELSARPDKVKNQPVIKVGVYNYADVARPELRVAEHQVTALFALAGIRIAWSEYSGKHLSVSSGKPAPDFSVRILYASKILRARRISHTDALGQSIMAPGTQGSVPGRIANVFEDRVEHVSLLWGLFPRDVLGYALAHELGHLLLGPLHSHRGIMKADWTFRDLEVASRSNLRFLPSQVAALQRAARSLHKNPSLSVTAQR